MTDRQRRRLLELAAGVVVARGFNVDVHAAPAPERAPPQAGDLLVFADGERATQRIRVTDLLADAPPIAARPQDPATGVVRERRLNHILLLNMPVDTLTPATAKHAAGGIVAYSALCTHGGCAIDQWEAPTRQLGCVCHGSRFDATDAGRIAVGPATKPLAMLPLTRAGDEIVVAGPFTRRVGATTPTQ